MDTFRGWLTLLDPTARKYGVWIKLNSSKWVPVYNECQYIFCVHPEFIYNNASCFRVTTRSCASPRQYMTVMRRTTFMGLKTTNGEEVPVIDQQHTVLIHILMVLNSILFWVFFQSVISLQWYSVTETEPIPFFGIWRQFMIISLLHMYLS